MQKVLNNFFLVIAPGLEDLALAELEQKLPHVQQTLGNTEKGEIRRFKGGIEIDLPLQVGWALNVYLKIPTRILQRVFEFRTRDIPHFYEHMRKFEWNQFLRKDTESQIHVSIHESRISMKDRVEKATFDAISNYREHQPLRSKFLETEQNIFVRIRQDVATVSMDTSGAALYMRGYKVGTAKAPMRETLGAALWYGALRNLKHSGTKIESSKCDTTLIDPMCGSGTTITESLFFNAPSSLFRKFSFENFPMTPQVFSQPKWLPTDKLEITGVEGSDIDPAAVQSCEQNFEAVVKKMFKKEAVPLDAKFKIDDIYQARPSRENKSGSSAEHKSATVVLVNPPYGSRLAGGTEEYQELVQLLLQRYKPDVLGLIVPIEFRKPIIKAPHASLGKDIVTSNGGIDVRMEYFTSSGIETLR